MSIESAGPRRTVAPMEVTLIAAQSLDGFITKHDVPGTSFTSAADKKHFAATLARFDASIMGGETYRVARSFLRSRLTAARRRMVVTRTPAAFSEDAVPGQLEFTQASAREIVDDLARRGHRHCALLGGAQMHRLFLAAGCVDRIELSLEPRLFGAGVPLLGGALDVSLTLLGCERIENSNTLLATYRVERGG
ncbi:MAG: dihydrofolate reductase family protein [Opitutaceae bacterium]|nr:dihydrofolate reductase family protein [Opitutaceae bacterium]